MRPMNLLLLDESESLSSKPTKNKEASKKDANGCDHEKEKAENFSPVQLLKKKKKRKVICFFPARIAPCVPCRLAIIRV